MEITNCVTQETTNAAVMGIGSNEQEMLNFAIKNGIIDLPHLQDQVEMMKNTEILQNHQYKIWQGNNQKWYTYLPDGKDGRKQVKRSTKAQSQAWHQIVKENCCCLHNRCEQQQETDDGKDELTGCGLLSVFL